MKINKLLVIIGIIILLCSSVFALTSESRWVQTKDDSSYNGFVDVQGRLTCNDEIYKVSKEKDDKCESDLIKGKVKECKDKEVKTKLREKDISTAKLIMDKEQALKYTCGATSDEFSYVNITKTEYSPSISAWLLDGTSNAIETSPIINNTEFSYNVNGTWDNYTYVFESDYNFSLYSENTYLTGLSLINLQGNVKINKSYICSEFNCSFNISHNAEIDKYYLYVNYYGNSTDPSISIVESVKEIYKFFNTTNIKVAYINNYGDMWINGVLNLSGCLITNNGTFGVCNVTSTDAIACFQ